MAQVYGATFEPNLSPVDGSEAQLSLHAAISLNKDPNIANVIREAYSRSPQKIHEAGLKGYTTIHIAAMFEILHALRTLLDLGVADDLTDTTNEQKATPLEVLKRSMVTSRAFMEDKLNLWQGYSTETLTCEYLLKQCFAMPLLPPKETEYISQRKFGCSCGNCLEGWFSERMRYRLESKLLTYQCSAT